VHNRRPGRAPSRSENKIAAEPEINHTTPFRRRFPAQPAQRK
jgi:hypothetical protein